MFFEVHRLSVFTPRSLDVDVVLDLMIHDLDIVLAFAKSPVKEVRAVGLPILSGKVDIANVRLEFESGCVANLTASRVSTERVRKLRFFPAAPIHLARLWTAGSIGFHGRTERRRTEERWAKRGRNAFGESADRGEQTAGGFGRAAARGAEVVSAGGAGRVPRQPFRWRMATARSPLPSTLSTRSAGTDKA
jgi:predicted dehydrogenase